MTAWSLPAATRWSRAHLFSGPLNIGITLLAAYFLLVTLPPAFRWLFVDAVVTGSDVSVCKEINADGLAVDAAGACWTFVKVRLNQMLFGLWFSSHPEEIWRPILAFLLVAACVALLVSRLLSHQVAWKVGLSSLVVLPLIIFALLNGSWLGLPITRTSDWGGLMLTLVLALTGIVAALPIGILLALGRRSTLPVVRAISVIWIEFFRGTPLITILFIASVLLPLFFPSEIDLDKVLRALVAITVFQSAYTAEAIRGGLQSLDRGQTEGAHSLGMGYWLTTILIVLPQALKVSIPAIVNSFIELFKDTSLILIIGLLDLLNAAQTASRSAEWKGYDIEAYIFAALIYFAFCFSLSQYSQKLERELDTSQKGLGAQQA